MEKLLRRLSNQGYVITNLASVGGPNSYMIANGHVGLFVTFIGDKAYGCAVPENQIDGYLMQLSSDMAENLQFLGAWAIRNCQYYSSEDVEYLSGVFRMEDILCWAIHNEVILAPVSSYCC